jgi:hypothetical protein
MYEWNKSTLKLIGMENASEIVQLRLENISFKILLQTYFS